MKKLLPQSKNNPQVYTEQSRSGFTLVELMVVVAIIAILSVVGVTVFSGVQKNARNSARKADIVSISDAIEAHYNNTTNQYCTGAAGTYCAPVTTWFAGGAIPKDPSTSADYAGLPVNGATTYTVTATLEGGGTFSRSNNQ